MRQKTVNTKLLESVTEVCYKVRQVLQSVTLSLQNALGFTKCDNYYKVTCNTFDREPIVKIVHT